VTGRRLDGLRLVALLKFAKALVLILTAVSAHELLKPEVAARVYEWSVTLTDRFERNLLLQALHWAYGDGTGVLRGVVVVTAAYTALVLAEAVGLWLRRSWGQWLTVVATSALIPFEVWKLLVRPLGKQALLLGVLLINGAIVVYLIAQLRPARRRLHRSSERR
jgi:uncharacterized membrane protein (DUF2068 family)